MNWSGDVVGELCRLRAAGVRNFDVAWSYAVEAFPPRRMELGRQDVLFHDEEPVYDFVRRRARAEWDGECIEDYARAFATVFVEASGTAARKRRGTGQTSAVTA